MNRTLIVSCIIGLCIIVIALVAAGVSLFETEFLSANAASQGTQTKIENLDVALYGSLDNAPFGNSISDPVIHQNGADGDGTFKNPTTFAADERELEPGTKIYVSYLKRYFIMENTCGTCTQDLNKEPPVLQIDLWIGDQGTAPDSAVTQCEAALARKSVQVTVNPASNLQVISGPLFSPSNGCFNPNPSPTPTPYSGSYPYVKSGNGQQANVNVTLTWYGFDDNSGQVEAQHGSADVAFPKNQGYPTLHNFATEGKGTFNDPITFAVRDDDHQTFPIGSVIYYPLTHKYYIMEDLCGDTYSNGCAAGSHHIDLWMGPDYASGQTLKNCEYNAPQGIVDVIINPSPNLPFETTPELNNGQCTLKAFLG